MCFFCGRFFFFFLMKETSLKSFLTSRISLAQLLCWPLVAYANRRRLASSFTFTLFRRAHVPTQNSFMSFTTGCSRRLLSRYTTKIHTLKIKQLKLPMHSAFIFAAWQSKTQGNTLLYTSRVARWLNVTVGRRLRSADDSYLRRHSCR